MKNIVLLHIGAQNLEGLVNVRLEVVSSDLNALTELKSMLDSIVRSGKIAWREPDRLQMLIPKHHKLHEFTELLPKTFELGTVYIGGKAHEFESDQNPSFIDMTRMLYLPSTQNWLRLNKL